MIIATDRLVLYIEFWVILKDSLPNLLPSSTG